MRSSRLAVLGLVIGLAAAAIAVAPPPAIAAAQATVHETRSFGASSTISVDSLRTLTISVPQAAQVTIARIQKSGRPYLVVNAIPLPDSAARALCELQNRPAQRIAFAVPSEPIERPTTAALAVPIAPNRHGFSSALRVAGLVGTLRLKDSKAYNQRF